MLRTLLLLLLLCTGSVISLHAQEAVASQDTDQLRISGSFHWFGLLAARGQQEGGQPEGLLFGCSGQLDLLPRRDLHPALTASRLNYTLLGTSGSFWTVDAGLLKRLPMDPYNVLASGRVWLENYVGGAIGLAVGYPHPGDVRPTAAVRVVSDVLVQLPAGLRSQIQIFTIIGQPNALALSLALGPRVSISGSATPTP
ncbi:MAG: hypothetical protein KY467_00570 [Gemmatimonadetes bacterium]|nr:hypothetical protein [Gemmatimonadota bacterium]